MAWLRLPPLRRRLLAVLRRRGALPREFHRHGRWRLAHTMPEEHGGAGLGVTEAALVIPPSRAGGAMAAASSIHINMFGPHPIVVHGTPEQKARWIPPLIAGTDQACFGVTEPNAGLDTTSITTFAAKVPGGYRVNGRKMWTSTGQVANKILLLTRTTKKENVRKPTEGITLFYTEIDRSKVEIKRIPKMGRAAVDSNMTFIDDFFIPEEDRIGEEGKGFSYILDSLNPERVLVASEAVAIGQDALERAARYGRDRVVFGRPIGQNQAIQHPLAECWTALESAWLMAEGCLALRQRQALRGGGNAAKLLADTPATMRRCGRC